jgi:hypothetical protein
MVEVIIERITSGVIDSLVDTEIICFEKQFQSVAKWVASLYTPRAVKMVNL